MIDRVGQMWKHLTSGEICFVDTEPQLLETDPREIVLHDCLILCGGFSKSESGGRKSWYERSHREWGTLASHMRRVA